jgi:hypothetical protein
VIATAKMEIEPENLMFAKQLIQNSPYIKNVIYFRVTGDSGSEDNLIIHR